MSDRIELDTVSRVQAVENYRGLEKVEKEFSIEELRESISWGTRKVKLRVSNNIYSFFIINLSEQKKYGSKTSEKLDVISGSCSNAYLSVRENQVFLPTTEYKGQGKVTKKDKEKGIEEKIITKTVHSGLKRGSILLDEDYDYVQKNDIEVFNDENDKLEKVPSSLDLKNSPNEIVIEDTIDINQALDHDVKSRYVLFPVDENGEDDINLIELLFDLENQKVPKYLSFMFNFYPSYDPKPAFLQIVEENDNEYLFMNVGSKNETVFYGLESSVGDVVEIDDEFDFDLSI